MIITYSCCCCCGHSPVHVYRRLARHQLFVGVSVGISGYPQGRSVHLLTVRCCCYCVLRCCHPSTRFSVYVYIYTICWCGYTDRRLERKRPPRERQIFVAARWVRCLTPASLGRQPRLRFFQRAYRACIFPLGARISPVYWEGCTDAPSTY